MRVLAGVIAGLMLMCPAGSRAAEEEAVYRIECFEDLERLSEIVLQGEGAYEGEVWLMSDIEAVRPMKPVGDALHMFSGVFDGRGHAVSDLVVEEGGDYAGLFGCVGREGEIRNLRLENVLVTGGRYAGAVAGYSAGVIEGCSVSGGRVIGTGGSEFGAAVGGIAGMVNGTIGHCLNLDVSVYGNRCVGGIAGGLSAGRMENCVSGGDVFSVYEGEAMTGGVAGAVHGGSRVENCIALSYICAERAFDAGGIAGGVFGGSLVRCIFLGKVNSREPGAIAGSADKRAQIMCCLYDGQTPAGVGEGRQDGTLHIRRGRIRPDMQRLRRLAEKR